MLTHPASPDLLARALARERRARTEAERLLEERSRALFDAHLALQAQARDLERQVTERTAAWQREAERAAHLTAAMGEFLAMMSHEIRTPLHGVLGTAELLATTALTAEQRGYVETLRRSGDGLLVLINDILDLSRLDARQMPLADEPYALRDALAHTVALFRPQAENRGLDLVLSIDDRVPDLTRGDSHRLRQVVGNLLSNALKFTPAGAVTLRADRLTDGASPRLRLTVTDTGTGMTAAVLERLFQPYAQADAAVARRHGGSGLGLMICHRLCEAMGGSIAATSVEGAGSCFTVILPLPGVTTIPPSPAATDPSGAASLPAPGRQARVLLVDDDPVNRRLGEAMLAKLGHLAETVGDGRAAVERVAAQPAVDLVLMDVQLPGLDGLEATRAIRALGLERQPVIVALTANAFDTDRARCLAAGMDDFMTKPMRLTGLRQRLAVWLPEPAGSGGR